MRTNQLSKSNVRLNTHSTNLYLSVGTRVGPTKAEYVLVTLILLGFCCLQLKLAMMLDEWGVFGQYNIIFDSDPNRYKGLISSGWGAGGFIHPAFGLAINPPLRIVDLCLSFLGIFPPGTFRHAAPLLLSPFMAVVGGIFWWQAAVVMNFPGRIRVLGLVFSQLAFSQTVFSSIPESFATSGMLLSLLLYMSVLAVQRPAVMHARATQLYWLLLACAMSGVTVTNGLMCIYVWLVLRLKTVPLRQLILEGIAGISLVAVFVFCTLSLSGVIYSKSPPRPAPSGQAAKPALNWHAYFDGSIAERAAHYPVAVLSSVIAPQVEVVANQLAKPGNRHQVQFSIQDSNDPLLRMLAWTGMLALAACAFTRASQFAKTVLAVLVFNGVLHSAFGSETFLYSQHWTAFVTFGIVLAVQRLATARFSAAVLTIVACATAIASGLAWSTMIENLT